MQNTPEKNLSSSEEFGLQAARKFVEGPIAEWWGPPAPGDYVKPLLRECDYFTDLYGNYYLGKSSADPLVPDLQGFFGNVTSWVTSRWYSLAGWFAGIDSYIALLWGQILAGLSDLATKIKNEIVGLTNFISNIWTWITWNLMEDITTFAVNLFRPIIDAWHTVTETLSTWFNYIWEAITNFLQDPVGWVLDLAGDLWDWLRFIGDMIWDSLVSAAGIAGSYINPALREFVPVLVNSLEDAALALWNSINFSLFLVPEDIVPPVYEAASGAYGYLKDQFTNLIGLAYDEIMQKATSLVPVTPERSAGIAMGMFGSAVGFGTLAHSMALAVEAVPNLKYLGVHYMSAFVARMGSFGTISSATMGVIAALAIREPFSYYMKSILRPTQPREMDLQIMAVKPDITPETFRQGMKYQGYSDFWIDAFERTMYHEPSYFEMSMLGEDEVATTEWLFTKARRSGYTEVDARVFVSSMIKKVTRDQRKEYYKQAFNAFKEGYISPDQFKEHLDHLDVRPEAKDLAVRAANMAYQTDLIKELITTYRRSFYDDLITEGECRASLSALGLAAERVDAIMELEWVRKEPKILRAERKEIETEWRKVQSEYSKVYVESFRRGLITEAQLVSYLIAIGIIERAARATARYEAIKKVPKPKPIEITVPVLPTPPEPPTYED